MIIEAGEYALSTRKLVLESAGLNVLSAVTAKQSLKLLDRSEADMAILDSDISDMPLHEIASILKEQHRLPVFSLSGREWPPEELRDVVSGHFQKIKDPQLIVNEVLRILDVPT